MATLSTQPQFVSAAAPAPLRMGRDDRVWANDQDVVEVFLLDEGGVKSFMKSITKSRCCNLCCCTLSVPVFGQVFGLLPPFVCVFGAHIEYICASPNFTSVQSSRKVALTTRGVKIRSLPKSDLLESNMCDLYEQFSIPRLDQFYVDEDFEEDSNSRGYKTRVLYYDQIRSASIIEGKEPVYKLKAGCCSICGDKVRANNRASTKGLSFVRIDIGKGDHPPSLFGGSAGGGRSGAALLKKTYNPIIVGLKDAPRFVAEVNKRAAGGANNSGLARAAVVSPLAIGAQGSMGTVSMVPEAVASPVHANVKAMPSAPPTQTADVTGNRGTQGSGLANELTQLKSLHDAGALTDDEFKAAKLAAISRATAGTGGQKV